MFLKNAWYVAAWSEEITRDLQQIVVLSEKSVFLDLKQVN